jgi:hypothetical protein
MSSRPTPTVQADATVTVTAIKGLLSAMPNENDISAPNDRERIWHARRTLSGIVSSLTSPFEGRIVKLDRRLAERKPWYQALTACQRDLEKELAGAEGSNFRLAEELRQSLRLIRDGSESAHDEVFAGPVVRWLAARGFRPDGGGGGFFAGRGGLVSAEQEIEELEKERDEIIGQLEASLEYAKQFIGGMATPVREAATTN